MKRPWNYLLEGDTELQALKRAAETTDSARDWDAYFTALKRYGRPMPVGEPTKDYRIRSGEWRKFKKVLAFTGQPRGNMWPARGVWHNKWVNIGRWNDDISYDIKTDKGHDPSDYDQPWLLGTGAGFMTLTFLVKASSFEDAHEAASDEWPDEFQDTHVNGELEYEVDVRVVQPVKNWVIARRKGQDYELLDGTRIPSVDVV